MTVIRGKVYDLTEFRNRHPGTHVGSVPMRNPLRSFSKHPQRTVTGGDVIRLGAGRDSSILFESYHPSTSEAHLAQFQVGVCPDAPAAAHEADEVFFRTLRARVEAYLKENGQTRQTTLASLAELIFTLLASALFYIASAKYQSWVGAMCLGFMYEI
jgi:hypothetical protein